jgi:hypothetical protein
MKFVLSRTAPVALALCCALAAVPAFAVVVPEGSRLADKSFRQDSLTVPEINQPLSALPSLAAGLQQELRELGVQPDSGFFDTRTGRWSSLILKQPVVPGTGYGNRLRWSDAVPQPRNDEALGLQTWNAVRAFLQAHEGQLRVDLRELATPRIGVFEKGDLIQIHAARVVGGLTVRDSGLTAIVNHGNLVLLGLQNWADASVPAASVSAAAAASRVQQHVSPWIAGLSTPALEIVPTLRGGYYDLRPVWVIAAAVADDHGSWEALVDAVTGDLLAFEDKNLYAQRAVLGGVYPVSNDQRPPDGIEQPQWPMPYANVVVGTNTTFTNSGGYVSCAVTGNATTTLNGQYIRINDNCGAINETSAASFDLGVSTGTDCVVPAGHSAGDTHSARSGFYELNRLKEQARGYLPGNTWLNAVLQSNMNISLTCNAFWQTSSGTVNFYRDLGSTCRNTGEIAAIFDHEWGHGLDANGTNPGISNPGESIADIHATMRLMDSCVGRGFRKASVCGGYGDPCTGTSANGCTGVRDSDFALHVSGNPHGITWIRSNCGGGGGPCGREVHCEGQPVAEIGWDLHARDLRAAPFSFDANTALELATRIFYLGAETVTNWYTCATGCETAGTCGCGATGGYLLMLAADDDDGNLNNGTPHMQAINAAFNRHQMACNAPAVTNAGCSGGPTTAPVVTATPVNDGVNLTWTAVPNAARYYVYRTEGVSACDFGKIKVGDTANTNFSDTGLLAGRLYSYIVLPVGSNTACFGRASTCASATPTTSGACVQITLAPQALAVDAGGNGVLQSNEGAVVIAPTWSNSGNSAAAVTGVASAFTGPAGPTYTVTDPAASYGTINAGSSAQCTDCYGVSISSTSRPSQHWDSTILETVAPTGTTKNWTLHVGDSFTDVAGSNAFFRFIETIFHKSVTGGCAAGTYCPSAPTTREQMSAFVLVSREGAGYNPPACVPPNLFSDVPETNPFCKFIEEIANRGVVTGCGPNRYCPTQNVTREQMAVFVLRTLDPALNPPACVAGSEMFNDVPSTSPFCKWIEELARRAVVTGCGSGSYCPLDPVTREQMAVFLTATFGLQLYGL